MIEIIPFQESDTNEIIKLVLHCQNDGSRPIVGIDDQPELLYIREKYIAPGGCFFVAKDKNRVAGSIGLMNYGNKIGILKKFFVYEAYRSAPYHLGQKLYGELLSFALQNGFAQLVLDTPRNTDRAHKFYEKAGFIKISKEDLPVQYDYPYKESDFFILTL